MILGIDLGTTNSLAAVVREGKVEFVDFEGSRLLPSIVAFSEGNKLLVGQMAKNQYYINTENSVKSIKRLMGSDTKTRLGGTDYLPEEIAGIILKRIKETAEKQLGQEISTAVITVPAYFSDDQRKATAMAGEIAGFQVERIINEPTAASLAYNFNHDREIKAVVYDFGGGTFDVSVVNIARNMVEVISSHGDNQLGGDDIDREFGLRLAAMINEKYQVALPQEGQTARQLMHIAEKGKIELSDNPYVNIVENLHLDRDKPPLAVDLEISRGQFEEVMQPFVERTMNLVHVAMKDAGLNVADIDQILLVGGTSKIPLIARAFEAVFDIAPSESINPDLSVCFGSAIQGAIINDDTIQSILVDVTPYTFGTRAVKTSSFGFIADDDVFVPLIKRNSPLPISKSELFYKLFPEQETIDVDVLQGESEYASENKRIGSFKVQNLSKKQDSEEIILSMNLNLNGILTVVATERKTGQRKQITIDNSFRREDISKSIDKLAAIFGDEDRAATASLNQESTEGSPNYTPEEKESHKIIIAKTMIEKAESKMESADPDDGNEMKEIIIKLNQAIVNKNINQVEALTDELTDIVFYLD